MMRRLNYPLMVSIFVLAVVALASMDVSAKSKPKKKPCPAPPAEGEAPAYTEIEVVDPGTLSGRAIFEGEYQPQQWKVVKDRDFCGDAVADESLVAADGGLRFVAVYLEEIKEGKALSKTVREVANKQCLYQPHVETFTVCDKIMITNHDPILHNTHAYIGDAIFEPSKPSVSEEGLLIISEEDFKKGPEGASMSSITTLFNIGLPSQDFKPKKTMRKPGLVTLKCDAGHTWMTGFVVILPHPYHTVTDAEGKYSIEGIPAGEYTVVYWHEKLGEQKHQVTIKGGAAATQDVTYKLQ